MFDDMDSATRINLWGCMHKEVVKRILDGTDMFEGFANIKQARDAIGIDVEWHDETRGGQAYLLLAFEEGELAGFYAGETLNKRLCRHGHGSYGSRSESKNQNVYNKFIEHGTDPNESITCAVITGCARVPMVVKDYTYTNKKGETKQGKSWKVCPCFLEKMGSEETAVTSATKQLCGCMELMTGFAACIGGGRMGASTERDQDWRIGKARQCCNIKSLGTVGFGFSRADCQLGGGNSYNKRGKEAFLQAMETGREFAYQASPSYDGQAFEAATEEERDGIARSAIHPANKHEPIP